ncbi:Signal transduction histidine kinase [Amycolatopsis xylanica]|uniref:histidine kinase n=1 Tax=Amycolatopsis xylanica TaxID=589385 RepID=A0A1H2YJM7_9PSEU|nr:Signal transduction histidine kinase [Amycolatopsis xylanica]
MPTIDTAGVGGTPAQRDEVDAERQPAKQGRSFLGMRNWRLRSKLAAILIVPTLVALALGGLRAYDGLDRAAQFQLTADQVDFATKVTAVIHELEGERYLAVGRIASDDPTRQAALDQQINKVDRVVDELRTSANELKTQDQATKDRYTRGLQRLDALRPLRSASNTPNYSELAALNTYSSILDALVQLGREINTSVADRELLRQAATAQAISQAKEFVARGDAALEIAGIRQAFTGDILEQIRDAQASGSAEVAAFLADADPTQRQLYSDTFSGPEVDDRQRLRVETFARNDQGLPPNIDKLRLSTDSAVALGKLRAVESNLLTTLRNRADDLASQATRAAWIESAIVALALVAALALMLLIARLMLRPLKVLQTSALNVARGLPDTVQAILDNPDPVKASKSAVEPVPVDSTDEIGEVARSFDVVHEQAVKMAAEQALLRENVNGIFVNLSRRSQRLVERQLGVIDRLEADEQDPDHLASLFELDHLATRLRRNGESLLVLSGAGLAKSVPKPVPAADVIGAAVSEIEQYARIEVGIVPDVAVQGLTIHDLVHVLAELLDNATYFSEPETKVTVRAVITRKKALAIQVTDHGVGMSEDAVAEVNQRLAEPPDLDVAVTRRMGLYVVARLAKRHGIEVRLRENEDIEGGMIARVVVPAELLTPLRSGADARQAPPVTRAETSNPSWPSMPSIPPVNKAPSPMQSSLPSYPPVPAEPSPSSPPAAPAPATANGSADNNGGLKPLDQPISLDDLVSGSNKAYRSPNPPPPPAWPTTEDIDTVHGEGASADASEATAYTPLVLPKREPKYVAPEPPKPEKPAEDAAALEDDVPTRRLPIYQSVLSRWFSEDGEEQPPLPPEAKKVEPTLADEASADIAEREAADQHQDSHTEVVDTIDDADEAPRAPAVLPAPEPSWRSSADEGWQAAQSLLETKNEEITPAGLPKRVPNAYLVPGSIGSPSDSNAFTDTTSAQPGTGAIARSASAARNRMASFQRGYTSGRHAMKEQAPVGGGAIGSESAESSEE